MAMTLTLNEMKSYVYEKGWKTSFNNKDDLATYVITEFNDTHIATIQIADSDNETSECGDDTESIGSIGDYIDLIDPEDAEYPSKIEQSFLDDPSDFAEPCPEPNRLLLHIREPNANKKLFDIVVPVKNIYISDVKQMICEDVFYPGGARHFYAEPPFEGKYLLGSRFARSALNHHLDVHF